MIAVSEMTAQCGVLTICGVEFVINVIMVREIGQLFTGTPSYDPYRTYMALHWLDTVIITLNDNLNYSLMTLSALTDFLELNWEFYNVTVEVEVQRGHKHIVWVSAFTGQKSRFRGGLWSTTWKHTAIKCTCSWTSDFYNLLNACTLLPVVAVISDNTSQNDRVDFWGRFGPAPRISTSTETP